MTYSEALEKRVAWIENGILPSEDPVSDRKSTAVTQYMLTVGETYFMNSHMAAVVDAARRTVPDNLAFDFSWLVTPAGWMWVDIPFNVPLLDPKDSDSEAERRIKQFHPALCAVSWVLLENHLCIVFFLSSSSHRVSQYFNVWSYLTLHTGDLLGSRIREFEENANKTKDDCPYAPGRETDELHELRWFYTAMHIMSQKMTVAHRQPTERGTRKRLERTGVEVKDPTVRVVSLRRLEEDRKKDPCGHHVDWKWHWSVTGHWRNQYCPSDKSHKTIWIESYVKGDMHQPFKPKAHTIYMVKR